MLPKGFLAVYGGLVLAKSPRALALQYSGTRQRASKTKSSTLRGSGPALQVLARQELLTPSRDSGKLSFRGMPIRRAVATLLLLRCCCLVHG